MKVIIMTKNMAKKNLSFLFVVLFVSASSFAATAKASQKDDLNKINTAVKVTADQILALAKKKPSEKDIKKNADRIISPILDFPRMARFIMGAKLWKQATEAQKDLFIKEFKAILLTNYSSYLTKVKNIKVGDAKLARGGKYTSLMQVELNDGNKIDILYRFYKNKKKGEFLIYDVVIENLSLLLSYRDSLSDLFNTKGIKKTLDELKKFL